MGRIVCFTGLGGSGKSEITHAMESDSRFGIIRLGENVREKRQLEKFNGTTEEYAEKFRFSSICEYIKDEIETMLDSKEVIIIDSVRTMADYQFMLRMSDDVKLIMIVADRSKRLEWLKNRKRRGDPVEELMLAGHDYWELNYGISSLFGCVDKFFVNEGSISNLQYKVMEYINDEC